LVFLVGFTVVCCTVVLLLLRRGVGGHRRLAQHQAQDGGEGQMQ